eukprot:sb/3471598/
MDDDIDDVLSDSSEELCVLTSNVNATPKISGELKPTYLKFYKNQLCFFSATISDNNLQIIPDSNCLTKPMFLPFCHANFARHASDFLSALTSGGAISLASYRKPGYIFVNTGKKKILISFINEHSHTDSRMYFEGTEMSLKGTLKCSLPIIRLSSMDELEKKIKSMELDLEGSCFCRGDQA